jgi:hypothetical protein
MLFWQSGHRIEEMREEPAGGKWALPLGRRGWSAADFKRRAALLDVVAGMAFSQIVAAAIMIATSGHPWHPPQDHRQCCGGR